MRKTKIVKIEYETHPTNSLTLGMIRHSLHHLDFAADITVKDITPDDDEYCKCQDSDKYIRWQLKEGIICCRFCNKPLEYKSCRCRNPVKDNYESFCCANCGLPIPDESWWCECENPKSSMPTGGIFHHPGAWYGCHDCNKPIKPPEGEWCSCAFNHAHKYPDGICWKCNKRVKALKPEGEIERLKPGIIKIQRDNYNRVELNSEIIDTINQLIDKVNRMGR